MDSTRRQFLGATGTMAVASMLTANRANARGVGQPVSATEVAQGSHLLVPGPPGQRTRYAIVGLGKFAVGQILPAFAASQRSTVTALVSGDTAKAKALAQTYGVPERNLYSYETYDQLRNNPDVDAVYIVLPNGMHAEYTIRAAQAGKHVLCEKPLATTSYDAQKMVDATHTAGVKLMTAYRVRYENYNRTMIQWSREQKYGKLQFISSDSLIDIGGAKQWRLDPTLAGGGSLMDIGIYSLNAARYLTGEEPLEINAFMHSDPSDSRFHQVEQSIAFQLRFPSGVLANCTSSYSAPATHRYRVVATQGWYGLEPSTAYRGQVLQHGHGEHRETLDLAPNNQFAAMMDHFSECVQNHATPLTPGEEGLRDVRLIERIYQAAHARETVKADV